MKKQIKNLAQKLALATTLTLSTITQTQAQNHFQSPTPNHFKYPTQITESQILHHMGHSMQHNAHHTHNPTQYEIGNILHNTAHLINIYEMQNSKYHLPQRTKHKPVINFFVYDSWKDLNHNGWPDNRAELRGRLRETFHEDEKIQIGTLSFWLEGSRVGYKMFCPNGEEIYSKTLNVNHEHAYAPLADFNQGLPKTLKKHGPGIYSTKFFVDNKHIGTRNFRLIPNPAKQRNLESSLHSCKQKTSMSQKEKDYYEREKAMHREESKKYQTHLSPSQRKTIQQFHNTIRQRANAMNKAHPRIRADPLGYNFTEAEILKLHKTYGNFSEQNIRKFIKP
ncbi:hypothetical protein HOE04_00435 [archaeon]|jgi:hypothetical protein|nr:hypothetical protein [archaeon]